jgi:hypothetical protein
VRLVVAALVGSGRPSFAIGEALAEANRLGHLAAAFRGALIAAHICQHARPRPPRH